MPKKTIPPNDVEQLSILPQTDDIYLYNAADVKKYLLSIKTLLKSHFILIHLDMNNKVTSEQHVVNLVDFRYFCLQLTQFFILQNTAKILIVRTDKETANFGKSKDYAYCRALMSLTKVLGVRLLDYIVMQGEEFDSFKEDHGSIA